MQNPFGIPSLCFLGCNTLLLVINQDGSYQNHDKSPFIQRDSLCSLPYPFITLSRVYKTVITASLSESILYYFTPQENKHKKEIPAAT